MPCWLRLPNWKRPGKKSSISKSASRITKPSVTSAWLGSRPLPWAGHVIPPLTECSRSKKSSPATPGNGGVSQWTADCWVPGYRGAPEDGSPREAHDCMTRVLRGGSFRADRDDIAVSSRGDYDAPVRYIVNGFRVARDE